jgi:hypothetical protein
MFCRSAVLAHPTVSLHDCPCPFLVSVHLRWLLSLSRGSQLEDEPTLRDAGVCGRVFGEHERVVSSRNAARMLYREDAC